MKYFEVTALPNDGHAHYFRAGHRFSMTPTIVEALPLGAKSARAFQLTQAQCEQLDADPRVKVRPYAGDPELVGPGGHPPTREEIEAREADALAALEGAPALGPVAALGGVAPEGARMDRAARDAEKSNTRGRDGR